MNAWISKTGHLCPIVEPAVASQLKTLPFSLEVDWADCGVSHEAQMQSVSFPRNQSPFCQDLMSWKGARGRRESSWSSQELLGGSSSGGGGAARLAPFRVRRIPPCLNITAHDGQYSLTWFSSGPFQKPWEVFRAEQTKKQISCWQATPKGLRSGTDLCGKAS